MKVRIKKVLWTIVDEIAKMRISAGRLWMLEDNILFYDYMLKNIEIGISDDNGRMDAEKTSAFRETILDGVKEDTLIEDSFLVYSHCGHQGWHALYICEDLKSVETKILNGGGYMNMFTTDMVVLIDGVVKNFNVVADDKNGKKIIFNKDSEKDNLNFDLSVNKGRKIHTVCADGFEYNKDYVETMLEHCSHPEDYEEVFNVRVKWKS